MLYGMIGWGNHSCPAGNPEGYWKLLCNRIQALEQAVVALVHLPSLEHAQTGP